MGAAFIPVAVDVVDPPADVGPVPKVPPVDAEAPPPIPIPPPGDVTAPPDKFVPSVVFASADVVPAEAAPPGNPCAFDATARETLAGAISVAWANLSDAPVPSRRDALPSKSILKGPNECRYKYAKFHCHKKSVWAVIETRRNQEKRVVSMLPKPGDEPPSDVVSLLGSKLSTIEASCDQGRKPEMIFRSIVRGGEASFPP